MACKSSFRQNYRTKFSPTVPTSAAGISHVVADVEAPGSRKWEHLKSGGKQWQATPKNLPRMQRTRAIPVAWLNSGLCPDRPNGWIPIIIIEENRSKVKRRIFVQIPFLRLSPVGIFPHILHTNIPCTYYRSSVILATEKSLKRILLWLL